MEPLCKGKELLFIELDDVNIRNNEHIFNQITAKAICTRCPLFAQCRIDNDKHETLIGSESYFAGRYACIYAGEDARERYNRRMLSQ